MTNGEMEEMEDGCLRLQRTTGVSEAREVCVSGTPDYHTSHQTSTAPEGAESTHGQHSLL
jgi:hypothetical protein